MCFLSSKIASIDFWPCCLSKILYHIKYHSNKVPSISFRLLQNRLENVCHTHISVTSETTNFKCKQLVACNFIHSAAKIRKALVLQFLELRILSSVIIIYVDQIFNMACMDGGSSGTIVSQGSYLNRSYIKDISITFISEKEFFIFIVFYPLKTHFLFSLNFEFSLQDEAGWCVFFLCSLPVWHRKLLSHYHEYKERSASIS